MGKVRHVMLGDEQSEKEQKKKAEARRELKKAKKTKDEVASEEAVTPDATQSKKDAVKKQVTDEKVVKTRSKRYQEAVKLIDKNTFYPMIEAVTLVKKTSLTKFDGTVEAHVNVSVNSMKDRKDTIRGTVNLPHGTGKEVKVAIADEAIIAEIERGVISFDILIAHPSMMPKLAKVARVLGPKGLMPNPKTNTVTPDPEKRAKELAGGQVNYKSEPNNPIIHQAIGKVSFAEKDLVDNLNALIEAIGANKIEKCTITATMGPGIKVSLS